jgi:hypothetical protein
LEQQYEADVVGKFLVNSLISQIDWSDTKRHKDLIQLLASKITNILSIQPNFSSIICNALENVVVPEDFVSVFSGALKLTYIQEITFALAMTKSLSENIVKIGTFII